MPKARPLVWVYKMDVDVDRIASGLHLTRAATLRLMKNIRFSTWLAAEWARGFIPKGIMSQESVFRGFDKGNVLFQTARTVGASRNCTPKQLLQDAKRTNWFIVVDFRGFPEVAWYEICADWIEQHIREKIIKVSGISPAQFDEWIEDNFEVSVSYVDYNAIPRLRDKLGSADQGSEVGRPL